MEQMSLLPTEGYGGDAIVDGNYRYQLRRWWSSSGKILVWVLLNPSTADGTKNDTTLRRIISFTQREGYSRLVVVNLFAYRSPYPRALKQVAEPVGPANDQYLQGAFEQADKVVAGWGAFDALQGRDLEVLRLCTKPVFCLGTTQQGYPRHPSRLASATPLVPYTYALAARA
jgi:hypothetical protein